MMKYSIWIEFLSSNPFLSAQQQQQHNLTTTNSCQNQNRHSTTHFTTHRSKIKILFKMFYL